MTAKKSILAALSLLICVFGARAQVTVVQMDQIAAQRMSSLKAVVVDSISDEPIAFASVYLKAKKDTVITNFTLTDTAGVATIKDIPRGEYHVIVEFMGYKPQSVLKFFRESTEDLGTIRLQPDYEALQAARVQAAGNPLTIQGDTLIYNAAAFKAGSNDMLGDLLKKMPGIEVGSDGRVKVNGADVSKITVNGRTFFFDDPTVAVKNLPASIVDKVKVTDSKSEESKFTGIKDNSSDKVMDVALRKEYEDGWFGNARLSGGEELDGSDDGGLGGHDKFLYNGNALLSGYSAKDQLTLIANAYNVPAEGGTVFIAGLDGGDDDAALDFSVMDSPGVSTMRQGAANFNTSRVKGFDVTAAATATDSKNDSRSRVSRTTFQSAGDDMLTGSYSKRNTERQAYGANIQIRKTDASKFSLNFEPSIKFTRSSVLSRGESSTSTAAEALNSSVTGSYSKGDNLSTAGTFYLGVKGLGKEGRSLTFSGRYSYRTNDSRRKEYSLAEYSAAGTSSLKDLFYDISGDSWSASGGLNYVEPLSKGVSLQLGGRSLFSGSNTDKNAYNPSSPSSGFIPTVSDFRDYSVPDEYYSVVSNNDYQRHTASALLQCTAAGLNFQTGMQLFAVKNETHSKRLGVETDTGQGEWLWNWAPSLSIRYDGTGKGAMLICNGYSQRPDNSLLSPVPDISDPTRISLGNIYLKPSFRQMAMAYLNASNARRQSSMFVSGSFSTVSRGFVTASWFDDAGVMYSIPVNAKSPSYSLALSGNYSAPIDSDKRLRVSPYVEFAVSRSNSYQSRGILPGLDVDTFSYDAFMASFWGTGSSGDVFYGGGSGFDKSRTTVWTVKPSLTLAYRYGDFSARAEASAENQRARYSLNPDADADTWDNEVSLVLEYTTRHAFELETSLEYDFYRGYSSGYGDPELKWDISVSKNVGSFNLFVIARDILDQTRLLHRSVNSNYAEDRYSNLIGRHFQLGVKYNFGKMSATRNENAMRAVMNASM